MAIKSILFNTEMVKAILDGRKTRTRRVVKPQPIGDMHHVVDGTIHGYWMDGNCQPFRPLYLTGDILYVRETFAYIEDTAPGCWHYRASANDADLEWFRNMGWKWHPSRYMPKEAARIFLRVKDMRVERLQKITNEQALAEGVPDNGSYPLDTPVYCPVCKGEGLFGTVDPETLGFIEVDCPCCNTPIKRFANLWNSTVKKADLPSYGWEANPWVWVIEFERCEKPEGWCL